MVKTWESKKEQEKRYKEFSKFLKDRGLPPVKKNMFMDTERKARYRSSRSEKHYRKERVPKVGEITQTSYGNIDEIKIGSTEHENKAEFWNRMPNVKGINAQRKYQKVGGLGTPLKKINRGKNIANLKMLQQQVNMSQKQVSNPIRKIDEINSAGFRDKHPSKVVQAFSRAQKNRQEAQKKKAMRKFRNPYSRTKEVGHNLKRGQADGDKGRRLSAEKRKK